MSLIIASNYDSGLLDELRALGYDVLPHPAVIHFKSFLKYHTDLYFCKIEDRLFVSSLADDELLSLIPPEYSIVKCEGIKEGYPFEVGLNCLYVNGRIFCNTRYVSAEILRYSTEKNIEMIHTNQAYTKCSSAVVGDNAVITEDKGIADTLSKNGIDVLLIEEGMVSLPGFDRGFIGGASFFDASKNTLFFFGNVQKSTEFSKINRFCADHSVKIYSLKPEMSLLDIGSAVLL